MAPSITPLEAVYGLGGNDTLTASAGGNLLAGGAGADRLYGGSGADTFQLGGVGTGTFDLSTLGAQYTGFSIFNKIGASTWIVTNTQSVTTPWTISSGLLIVNGSLANATSVTVSGGTLGGTGTVSTTNVNAGGTLAPGNSTNPTGTLIAPWSVFWRRFWSGWVPTRPISGRPDGKMVRMRAKSARL